VLGKEDPEIASSLAIMAMTRAARGDLPGAEALSREALAIQLKQGKDRYETSVALLSLGAILAKEGDKDGAETLYRETLAIQRKVLGSEHPNLATTLNFLGNLAWERGDLVMAETSYREALAILGRQFSNEHPEVAGTLINLGMVLTRRRDFAGAEKLVSEEVAILRKVLGPEHPLVGKALACLGANRMVKGDGAAAEVPLREALAIRSKQLGNDHPELAELRLNLAICAFQRSDWAGAEANLLETLRIAALAPAGLIEVRDAGTKLLAAVYTRWAKKDPTKTEPAARWTRQWQEVEKAKADRESALRTASSQVKYANTPAADSAILQAFDSPFHLMLPPYVRILRIDGALIETGWFGVGPLQLFVPPGTRRLKIGISSSHFTYTTCAKETLEVDFACVKKYNLTAVSVGDDFDLKLWDATPGFDQQTLLKTWRLTGNRDISGYMTHLRD
jgi:tetratricopeptide (TPR) repeat protein